MTIHIICNVRVRVCVKLHLYTHINVLYYDNASTAALEPRSPYQRATLKTLLESLTRTMPPLPYASMHRIIKHSNADNNGYDL